MLEGQRGSASQSNMACTLAACTLLAAGNGASAPEQQRHARRHACACARRARRAAGAGSSRTGATTVPLPPWRAEGRTRRGRAPHGSVAWCRTHSQRTFPPWRASGRPRRGLAPHGSAAWCCTHSQRARPSPAVARPGASTTGSSAPRQRYCRAALRTFPARTSHDSRAKGRAATAPRSAQSPSWHRPCSVSTRHGDTAGSVPEPCTTVPPAQ